MLSTKPSVLVVDYKKGNIQSVVRSLEFVGAQVSVSADTDDIARADTLVLPGVGSFRDAADELTSTGQMDALREALEHGVPFLGICLGMHLLCAAGTEDSRDETTAGIGVLSGVVDALLPSARVDGRILHKVPHVGWDSVHYIRADCPIFAGIESDEYFYFTHSYALPYDVRVLADGACAVAATTDHTQAFPSVVWDGRGVFGVQFHPEKSSDVGSVLLENFVSFARS